MVLMIVPLQFIVHCSYSPFTYPLPFLINTITRIFFFFSFFLFFICFFRSFFVFVSFFFFVCFFCIFRFDSIQFGSVHAIHVYIPSPSPLSLCPPKFRPKVLQKIFKSPLIAYNNIQCTIYNVRYTVIRYMIYNTRYTHLHPLFPFPFFFGSIWTRFGLFILV